MQAKRVNTVYSSCQSRFPWQHRLWLQATLAAAPDKQPVPLHVVHTDTNTQAGSSDYLSCDVNEKPGTEADEERQ